MNSVEITNFGSIAENAEASVTKNIVGKTAQVVVCAISV